MKEVKCPPAPHVTLLLFPLIARAQKQQTEQRDGRLVSGEAGGGRSHFRVSLSGLFGRSPSVGRSDKGAADGNLLTGIWGREIRPL